MENNQRSQLGQFTGVHLKHAASFGSGRAIPALSAWAIPRSLALALRDSKRQTVQAATAAMIVIMSLLDDVPIMTSPTTIRR